MKLAQLLVVAATAASVAAGGVKKCHVCKTSLAAATFANLICDRIPRFTPDCEFFNTSSLTYLQFCSSNQLCLFISKDTEQLRMCTNKQKVETLRSTKGVLMTVCDRELCNGVGRAVSGAGQLLLLPLLLLTAAAAGRQ